jgi:hypothetical protein
MAEEMLLSVRNLETQMQLVRTGCCEVPLFATWHYIGRSIGVAAHSVFSPTNRPALRNHCVVDKPAVTVDARHCRETIVSSP